MQPRELDDKSKLGEGSQKKEARGGREWGEKERKKERVKEMKGKERKRKMVSSAREVRVKRAPRVGRHC